MIAYIPVRLNSDRLTKKPLIEIDNIPLVSIMANIAYKCDYIHKVVVLADSEIIIEKGSNYCPDDVIWQLSAEGECGTDRVFRYIKQIDSVEPFMVYQCSAPKMDSMELNHFVASIITNPLPVVHTVVCPMSQSEAAQSSNVKVAIGPHSKAWYFSRSMVPFGAQIFWKHLGVYVFSEQVISKYIGPNFINRMPKIPHPCESEDLEQLSWMAAGIDIYCTKFSNYVDTIDNVRNWIQWRSKILR